MKKQKPIHKFNGGIGATLCHRCSTIITTGFTDDLSTWVVYKCPNCDFKFTIEMPN